MLGIFSQLQQDFYKIEQVGLKTLHWRGSKLLYAANAAVISYTLQQRQTLRTPMSDGTKARKKCSHFLRVQFKGFRVGVSALR